MATPTGSSAPNPNSNFVNSIEKSNNQLLGASEDAQKIITAASIDQIKAGADTAETKAQSEAIANQTKTTSGMASKFEM